MYSIFLVAALFAGCAESPGTIAEMDYVAIGDSLSKKTFERISGILKNKISEEGFPAAVEYCNTGARDLTESFASQSILISRTTLKPRNEKNTPDELEKDILGLFQDKWNNGDSLTPVITTDASGNTHYFKAIILQPLCTGCHGTVEKEIARETFEMIQQKYPADLATGYKTGDLRGAWHITFLKQKK